MSEGYVFLAGAVSGIVEGLCVQPLELIKTRAQINQGASVGFIPAVRDILREGGVLQLYRGALPELTGLIPRATCSLATLEFSQRQFRSWNKGELPTAYAYLSGGLSGVSESIAFSPFQVIKVRLMAKEHLGRYKNTLDCLHQVVSNEGLSALTIGLAPTLFRNCVWNSIYYGSVFELEKKMQPLDSKGLELVRTAVVGTAVGIFATCFNVPFDVVKSRFQSQMPHQRKYTGVLQALNTIYREEGGSALFKGFIPKALRLGLGQTIGLMTFKQTMALLGADVPGTGGAGTGTAQALEWS